MIFNVCSLLGIDKLNITAYHPQCNGLMERFNHTLKTILGKQTAPYGVRWDRYLYGVLLACRNAPHESTLEKSSFLLFRMDFQQRNEAAFMPQTSMDLFTVSDYREELVKVLTSPRQCATKRLSKNSKEIREPVR